MEDNKNFTNEFKFGLYQNNTTIYEKIFSADVYNPVVRYTVDIRPMIPSFIKKLQKTLSKRKYDESFDFGDVSYNTISYYMNNNKYDRSKGLLEQPVVVEQNINGKIIRGVECKFIFYINNNPIVERDFYVHTYNPQARLSLDLHYSLEEIIDDILNYLKNRDTNHMWEDYTLIHTYSMSINQIRELSYEKRENLLRNLNNPHQIKNIKQLYRNLVNQQN